MCEHTIQEAVDRVPLKSLMDRNPIFGFRTNDVVGLISVVVGRE